MKHNLSKYTFSLIYFFHQYFFPFMSKKVRSGCVLKNSRSTIQTGYPAQNIRVGSGYFLKRTGSAILVARNKPEPRTDIRLRMSWSDPDSYLKEPDLQS